MFRLLLFMMISFSAALWAYGQNDTIIDLPGVEVISGRIFDLESAGMSISEVDSGVISQKIHLNLSDLLSENTPVFIKSHGRGALATASFRGTAPSHTAVNWNGIAIESPMTGMTDFSLIPVYLIDKIDLKHGAASLADQTGGLGGSINIGNIPDFKKRFGLSYLQGIGSFSTFDEFLDLGAGTKTFQARTRVYHNYSKNNFSFLNRSIVLQNNDSGEVTHPVQTNDHADYKKFGFLQEIYFMPDDRNLFSFRWWSQKADQSLPQATSYEGPEDANINDQITTDHRAMAQWNGYADKIKWLLRSAFTRKELDFFVFHQISGFGEVASVYSQSTQNRMLNHAALQIEMPNEFSIEAKFDHHYTNVETADSVQKTGFEKHRHDLSGFVSLRKGWNDRLNVNLLLRHEWIGGNRGQLIPFAGFDWRVIENKNLIVKGSVARNFRYPSLNDLYWQPGGNPDLKPEQGVSYELGLQYETNKNRQHLQSNLMFYHSVIRDWIIWIPGFRGYWEPQNIREVEAQGVEFNTRLKTYIGQVGVSFSGTYAYTRSRNYGDPGVWGDDAYGKQLVYVPLHSGNMMINVHYKSFSISYQYNAYSERFTTSSNDITRRDWLYPYFMNDVSLSKSFQMGPIDLSAGIKVYNLFDENYHTILYRPMPGRNYMLMIRAGFDS